MIHKLVAKTLIIATVAVILSTNVGLAEQETVSKLNWFQRTFKELSWNEVQLKAGTPKEICSAVRHHVEYRSDLGDDWASGKETWDRGYGDCEDFAAAISELCSQQGIETVSFMIYPENEDQGHVVVVGLWKNKLWFSSNGWFEYAKSGDEIKRKIAHEMRWKRSTIIAMDWDSFRGVDSSITPAQGSQRISLPIISR